MNNRGVLTGALLFWLAVSDQVVQAQGPEAFHLTSFWSSYDVIESRSGDVIVLDAAAVYRIGPDGNLLRIAGGAPFSRLVSVTEDARSGDFVVADIANAALYRVRPDGAVSTLYSGAPLKSPAGVHQDFSTLDIVVADRGAATLFRIDATGRAAVIAGGRPFVSPVDVTQDRTTGDFIVLDEVPALFRVSADGRVSALVSGAPFASPARVIQDRLTGDFLVSDRGQGTIYRVNAAGEVRVMARLEGLFPLGMAQQASSGRLLFGDVGQGSVRVLGTEVFTTGQPLSPFQVGTRAAEVEGPDRTPPLSHTFTDVDTANVFHSNITDYYTLGLTNGCVQTPSLQYCPLNNVTRQEMAAFMIRLYKLLTVGSVSGSLLNPPPLRGELTSDTSSPNLIGGSSSNSVTSGVTGATIAGGGISTLPNKVTDDRGTVGGGYDNTAGDNAGSTTDKPDATVGGGRGNTASGERATVAGGYVNTASGLRTTVGGGFSNTAGGSYSIVGGGNTNTASVAGATVGGGYTNTASGLYATVPGGRDNTASGGYSFAAGRRAKANHTGAFVWADSTDSDLASSSEDEFIVRASGGIWFGLNSSPDTPVVFGSKFINTSTGAYLSTGGTWTNASDRALKENFVAADGQKVLRQLADLPLATWNYKVEGAAIRHIGPTAQDFLATFGLGGDDKAISTVDAGGVALAAIQGLYQVVQEKEAQIAALEARLAALESAVASK